MLWQGFKAHPQHDIKKTLNFPVISGRCVNARSHHATKHILNVLIFEIEQVENVLYHWEHVLNVLVRTFPTCYYSIFGPLIICFDKGLRHIHNMLIKKIYKYCSYLRALCKSVFSMCY